MSRTADGRSVHMRMLPQRMERVDTQPPFTRAHVQLSHRSSLPDRFKDASPIDEVVTLEIGFSVTVDV